MIINPSQDRASCVVAAWRTLPHGRGSMTPHWARGGAAPCPLSRLVHAGSGPATQKVRLACRCRLSWCKWKENVNIRFRSRCEIMPCTDLDPPKWAGEERRRGRERGMGPVGSSTNTEIHHPLLNRTSGALSTSTDSTGNVYSVDSICKKSLHDKVSVKWWHGLSYEAIRYFSFSTGTTMAGRVPRLRTELDSDVSRREGSEGVITLPTAPGTDNGHSFRHRPTFSSHRPLNRSF
ncbi:hypothetical protein J6590_004073 [Homalodisca vitripennis]|nr:hypothetical protein J6590_004073 [Homalodisca vitripennis]